MSAPGRRWLELSVRAPSAGERAPLLAEGLVALGGRAVEERGAWYVTHVEEPADLEDFLTLARRTLVAVSGAEDVELRSSWRAHEDWSETWKRGLAPRRITDRIVVRPSWTRFDEQRPGDVVIEIDPGMAFGTAEHGTTRGCLRLLDGLVRVRDRVLDVGAGSGILSVAAARLGAAEVVAIEGDPLACEALEDNVARNGVADRVRVVRAWADDAGLRSRPPASGVVANIETGILRPLFPALLAATRPGGWLVVSGVLREEWPEVRDSIESLGGALLGTDADGTWVSAAFRRPV